MLFCWFLPLFLIAGVNIYYLSSDRLESRISKEIQRLRFINQSVIQRLEQAVEESRDASYDGVLMQLYSNYKNNVISERMLLSSSQYYLRGQYNRSNTVNMAVLWYSKDPKRLDCSTYNTGEGVTYANVKKYWNEDHEGVAALAKELDTRAAFYKNEDRIYLVRNLYTKNYENAGTLVLLLNNNYCFSDYVAFPENTSVTLLLDDCRMQVSGTPVTEEETGMLNSESNSGYIWDKSILRIFHTAKSRDHALSCMVRFEDNATFTLLYGYETIFLVMMVCVVPMMLLLLWAYHVHVTKPIQYMMKGAEEIEQGNFGYQLEYEPKSLEFQYLTNSFNSMSEQIKHQFYHIYEEEIALRDARIKALQSHINPHFMNNTLEIINWEARLSGNEKVSKMIEALGTLMDAGMDRKKRPEIPLSEEMVYVNAYLYITAERLGSRLTIINEFPDDIMEYLVPRLILQPVIENAIEHGVVKKGKGTVILYGYRQGDYLYLEIVNESTLTKEDKAKIGRLLDMNYDSSKEPSGNLGIANVNQRLNILYGDPCGLTVEQMDEDHVRSRLTIRVEEK